MLMEKKKSGEEGEIEEEEEHDYIDNETRREDFTIKQSLETIMREYSKEMNQRALEAKEQAIREAQLASITPDIPLPPPPPSSSSSSSTRRIDPNVSIDDEEGKRSLITNEILMFRDRFKDEETKMRNTEKERKDRYERERALQREKRAAAEEVTTGGHNKSSVSPPSSHDRNTSRRDRSSPSDDRHRHSSRNNTSNSVRSRASDRRSSPSRYDRRSPPRSYNRRSRTKSPVRGDDDDETYERKRQEKRLREKELRYRERLKTWEQRERKKQNEYELEKTSRINTIT